MKNRADCSKIYTSMMFCVVTDPQQLMGWKLEYLSLTFTLHLTSCRLIQRSVNQRMVLRNGSCELLLMTQMHYPRRFCGVPRRHSLMEYHLPNLGSHGSSFCRISSRPKFQMKPWKGQQNFTHTTLPRAKRASTTGRSLKSCFLNRAILFPTYGCQSGLMPPTHQPEPWTITKNRV